MPLESTSLKLWYSECKFQTEQKAESNQERCSDVGFHVLIIYMRANKMKGWKLFEGQYFCYLCLDNPIRRNCEPSIVSFPPPPTNFSLPSPPLIHPFPPHLQLLSLPFHPSQSNLLDLGWRGRGILYQHPWPASWSQAKTIQQSGCFR